MPTVRGLPIRVAMLSVVLVCLLGCTQDIPFVPLELSIDYIPGQNSLYSPVQIVAHAPTAVTFSYASSDTSVATVSSTGLVTPLSGGIVAIYVSAAGYSSVGASLTFNDVNLIGTWVYTRSTSSGPTADISTITWTFSSDGSYSYTEAVLTSNASISATGSWTSLSNSTILADHSHPYAIAGTTLTIDGFPCAKTP